MPKNLIAVTGTNGKSSIANFYYQILSLNNKNVASIGTLGVKSNNSNLKLSKTTIDPIQLGQILKKLKSQNKKNYRFWGHLLKATTALNFFGIKR